jgi:hypothetical protein
MVDGKDDLLAKADALAAHATRVFKPRTPITDKELFAGRWTELTTIQDAVNQPGLHVVIYGERGVGKTSLANVVSPTIWALDHFGREGENVPDRLVIKVVANSGDTFSTIWNSLLAEVHWPHDGGVNVPTQQAFGLPTVLKIDDVRRVLSHATGAVYIVDEFDQARTASKQFTELIKTLSDLAVDCTIILVGVSDTVDTLVAEHASVPRAIVQVGLERMKPDELSLILTNAEKGLNLKFTEEAANLIIHVSQGLPHYTHLIGLHAVRSAAHRFSLSLVERDDVFEALKNSVKQAEQTVTEKHSTAIHSSHKEALYRHILLACALAAARSHDSLGYFVPSAVVSPLSEILQRPVTIATFRNHLIEFCEEKRGKILERDGQPWGFRYRFHNPLLVPYIFMDGLDAAITSGKSLVQMLAEKT